MSDEITGIIESAAADLSAGEESSQPAPSVEGASAPETESAGEPASAGSAPSSDGGAPSAASPPESAQASATPSKPPVASSPSDAEEAALVAIEKELLGKNPTVRGRKMPQLRHQAILERTRRQHEQLLADAAQRIEAAKQYEAPEFQERLRAFQIAETNPDQFLQILQVIPQYKQRIEALVENALKQRAPAAPPPSPPVEDAEPQPDTLLDGGGMGYSVERANQLWEWRLRQARKEYDEKLAKIEAGVQPLQAERQARERIEQAYVRQGGILQDARANWPLFTQYEAKIRAELSKPGNERMQLDQAYRAVVVNAERADRARVEAEVRARIAQEMNGQAAAPRTLRPSLPPAEVTNSSGEGEVESIIRNAARSLG